MMKMEGLFDLPAMSSQQQSYPVIVTPNANGFILNVVDFDDLSFEVDNIQFGLVCIQDAITEKLVGYCPPVPTPYSDLVLSTGEFVLIVNI